MRFHIRRDDTVKVLVGKDRGKTGKVVRVYPGDERALVQGVNFVKRHVRRRQDQPGGILQQESPLALSNLMLVCPSCKKPNKTGVRILKDGSRVRFCKGCKEVI